MVYVLRVDLLVCRKHLTFMQLIKGFLILGAIVNELCGFRIEALIYTWYTMNGDLWNLMY